MNKGCQGLEKKKNSENRNSLKTEMQSAIAHFYLQ